MPQVIGTLPAGTEILGVKAYATHFVIATSEGLYCVRQGVLEKIETKWTCEVGLVGHAPRR